MLIRYMDPWGSFKSAHQRSSHIIGAPQRQTHTLSGAFKDTSFTRRWSPGTPIMRCTNSRKLWTLPRQGLYLLSYSREVLGRRLFRIASGLVCCWFQWEMSCSAELIRAHKGCLLLGASVLMV